MSRRLRTQMPTIPTLLKPTISEGIRERLTHRQQKQKGLYDRGAKPLPDLAPGDNVRYRVNKAWKPATVIKRHENPRSYYIQTNHGTVIRRNRYHLKRINEAVAPTQDSIDDECSVDTSDNRPSPEVPPPPELSQPDERRSRYGRIIRPPIRYQTD